MTLAAFGLLSMSGIHQAFGSDRPSTSSTPIAATEETDRQVAEAIQRGLKTAYWKEHIIQLGRDFRFLMANDDPGLKGVFKMHVDEVEQMFYPLKGKHDAEQDYKAQGYEIQVPVESRKMDREVLGVAKGVIWEIEGKWRSLMKDGQAFPASTVDKIEKIRDKIHEAEKQDDPGTALYHCSSALMQFVQDLGEIRSRWTQSETAKKGQMECKWSKGSVLKFELIIIVCACFSQNWLDRVQS